MVKILFDNRWFGETGIGRYAKEMVVRKPTSVELSHLDKNWAISNPFTPLILSHYYDASRYDLFWSPGFMPPATYSKPFVVTVHDLIHLHYGNWAHKIYYSYIIKPILRRATAILTDSEYSRNELIEWAGVDDSMVHSIPLGVNGTFTPYGPKLDLGSPYILYIGNRRVYKNIKRLIESFAISEVPTDIKLVLSGPPDSELFHFAKSLGIGGRLHFLGNIPEDHLPQVYRGAICVVYVSLYEGFGLPPLEAMACGVPAIASKVTSIPEVVGDAALLVDPLDVNDIASAITRIASNSILRSQLMIKGLEQSSHFSWNRTANESWEIIEKACIRTCS